MKTTKNKNIEDAFALLNFSIIHAPKSPSANGPDLWVRKNGSRPMSVELKQARIQKNGCVQVDPVLKNRRSDDLIAIICPGGYVLIESMKDHLKSCSPKGSRQMTLLCGTNP